MTMLAGFATAIVALLLGETAVSARNDRHLRAQGAVEPAGDVYKMMALAYPGAFVAMLGEGVWHQVSWDAAFQIGLAIFLLAKALKYWAIASLGRRWTFRVLVPPHSTRTITGPYRFIAHPNYVAVAGELLGVAMAMHAWLTGPIALAGFGALMLRRIAIEEAALGGAD